MTTAGEYEDTSGGPMVDVVPEPAPEVAPDIAEPVDAPAETEAAPAETEAFEEMPVDLGESADTSGGVPVDTATSDESPADEAGEDLSAPEDVEIADTAAPPETVAEDWEDGEVVDLRGDEAADSADLGTDDSGSDESGATESHEPADLGLPERAETADNAPNGPADPADLGAEVAAEGADPAPDQAISDEADQPIADAADQAPVGDLRNDPENTALVNALDARGMSLEAVDRFDFSDNPVLGYRESASAEDIGYAVTVWNEQIAPGLATGATRENFAAHDDANGLEGHQRLSGVYDYFLGDQAIKSGGERENGSLDVSNGRHRLEQARILGVAYLPVRN